MEVGLGSTYAGHVAYRTFDCLRVTFVGNLAVKDGDVILNRDVHSWDIEALLERSQTRTDSIGEYIVRHVGIRGSAGQPVADSIEPSTGVAKPLPEDTDAAPQCSRLSGGASDENDRDQGTGDCTDSEQSDSNGAFSHWFASCSCDRFIIARPDPERQSPRNSKATTLRRCAGHPCSHRARLDIGLDERSPGDNGVTAPDPDLDGSRACPTATLRRSLTPRGRQEPRSPESRGQ
jgi:hypothetical protein